MFRKCLLQIWCNFIPSFCFSYIAENCGYVYYKGIVQIPKRVSSQNIYYNYIVIPDGVSEFACVEHFYNSRRNLLVSRNLRIPVGIGIFHILAYFYQQLVDKLLCPLPALAKRHIGITIHCSVVVTRRHQRRHKKYPSHFSREPHGPAFWYLAQSISMENCFL